MISDKNIKIGLIYKYTSPSGKVYIGQTINEKSRKSQHRNSSLKEDKTTNYFINALRKYGYDNFKYEVIIKFNPTADLEKLKRVLNRLEERYIKQYDSNNPEKGYNLRPGGNSSPHDERTKQILRDHVFDRPQEWRDKLSEIKKKEYAENGVPDYCLKNLSIGKHDPKSEETKNKLREAHRSRMKKVGKFNLQLELIEEFESIEAAARSINGSTQKTKAKKISRCCNEGTGTAYSYVWLFITSP